MLVPVGVGAVMPMTAASRVEVGRRSFWMDDRKLSRFRCTTQTQFTGQSLASNGFVAWVPVASCDPQVEHPALGQDPPFTFGCDGDDR